MISEINKQKIKDYCNKAFSLLKHYSWEFLLAIGGVFKCILHGLIYPGTEIKSQEGQYIYVVGLSFLIALGLIYFSLTFVFLE